MSSPKKPKRHFREVEDKENESRPASDPEEADAIAYDTFSYTDERTLEPTALRLLQTAITTMTPSFEGDKPVVGNSRGLNLLERTMEISRNQGKMLDEIQEMRSRNVILEAKAAILEAKVASHHTQLSTLRAASERYLEVRQRFFEVYKREGGWAANQKLIKSGNIAAHGGDAITDASLYSDGTRHDVGTYRELYCYGPSEILDLEKHRDVLSIYVINQRAGLIADPLAILPPHVEQAFQDFRKALDDSWGLGIDLNQPSSKFTQAYWRFTQAYGAAERNNELRV